MAINLQYYKSIINNYKEYEIKLNKQSNKISLYRIITCLMIIVVLFNAYTDEFTMYNSNLILVLVIIFIYNVKRHKEVKRKLKRIRHKIVINERYLSRINGDWVNFKKNGEEFIDKNHPYTSDLDIYGNNSLFQFLNETNTYFGKEILSQFLSPSEKNLDTILKRQKAVKELSKLNYFCENLKCEGMQSEQVSTNPKKIIEYFESDEKVINSWVLRLIISILPILTVLLPLLIYESPSQPKQIMLLVIILIQVALYIFYLPKLSKVLNEVRKFKKSINNFKSMFMLIEQEKFESKLNKDMQKNLVHKKLASKYIKNLEYISDAIDIRHNPLIHIILNIFFLYDFHCLFALEDLRDESGKDIRKWLRTLGFFEALTSIAVLPQLYTDWTYPKITKDIFEINAKNMGHPLINNDKRVYNDLILKNTIIVSGSNMSGKTTFLRTIGINLILAYTGAPVCATQFTTPILDVYTSMRIQDNLKDNVSTFNAELIRVKKIIDNSRLRTPMIFLIDEIYRGTNTKDRIFGAERTLLQLRKAWIIGAISTHDLDLCSLEKEDNNFTNYYFSEEYIDNEIRFDYKIKKGISTTRNARYLMKLVGIQLQDE